MDSMNSNIKDESKEFDSPTQSHNESGLCPNCSTLWNGHSVEDLEACRGAIKALRVIKRCGTKIDLQSPVTTENRRTFQPPYTTVFVYICPACKGLIKKVAEHQFRGRWIPSKGFVRCMHIVD